VIKIVDVNARTPARPILLNPENLQAVDGKDEIKFVLSTRRDYEFAREFTREHGLATR